MISYGPTADIVTTENPPAPSLFKKFYKKLSGQLVGMAVRYKEIHSNIRVIDWQIENLIYNANVSFYHGHQVNTPFHLTSASATDIKLRHQSNSLTLFQRTSSEHTFSAQKSQTPHKV